MMDFAAFNFEAWSWALAAILALALTAWIYSLWLRDVSIVDSLWSLFFLAGLVTYMVVAGIEPHGRALIVLIAVCVWAIRLAGFLTWRNHGQSEDRRYQEIRQKNQPNFEFKSLYLVFGLQALLAWVICLPVLAAVSGQTTPGPISAVFFWTGVVFWVAGMCFETIADWQLHSFRSRSENTGSVLKSGLWRYSRHPNYFGEFTLWWGFYLMAVASGGAWTVLSPILMSVLLLRVSGVVLLEKDISERRPAYRQYIEKTNAFFPWRPRS